MATSVENVVSMIATADQLPVAEINAWRERAAKFVVIGLAIVLLIPVMVTFTVLALCVAKAFGIPISASALPDRRGRSLGRL
jgi:hypothetical protein